MEGSGSLRLGFGRVSGKEWRWAIGWTVFALTLASLPYGLGALSTNDHWVFTGSLFFSEDVNSYVAKMRSGRDGDWLFHNRYTAEPNDGVLVYLPYILWGKVWRIVGLSEVIGFHVARVLAGAVLLLCAYAYLAQCLDTVQQRKVGFLFLVFAAGVGWLYVLAGGWGDVSHKPTDLWVPESLTFFSLYFAPHFMLGEALLMAAFLFFGRLWEERRIRDALLCGGAGLLLSQVYPLAVVNLYAVIGVYAAWWAICRRRLGRRRIGLVVLALSAPLPAVVYGLIAFRSNSAVIAWQRGNAQPSPPLDAYLSGYGLLLVLSVVGIVVATRRRKPRLELPLIWFAVGWVLLYVPFAQQRRLSVGLQVPLCLWAAVGLVQGVQPFAQRCLAQRWNESLGRSSLAALVFSTSLTNVFLLAAGIFACLMHQEPSFVLYPEDQALHWLDKHTTPSDVVLCGHRMGSLIPARTSSRVFVGHWAETPDLEGKLVSLSTFFDPDIPERTREKMIETYGITYLFYGVDERALGSYQPSDDPHWILAFADEQVSVYRWRAR